MQSRHHQKGLTFISILFIVVLLGFVALFAIKLFPVYLEDFTVRSVLKSLNDREGERVSGPDEIRKAIGRRFGINNVKNVTANDAVIVPGKGGAYNVSIDYEVKQPFIYNVSLLLSFSHNTEAR